MDIGRRHAVATAVAAWATTTPKRAFATDPIRIGQTATLSGASAESGMSQVNGTLLAVEAVNSAGGVLGRPLEIVSEDTQSTNPGAVMAFSRLSGRSEIAAFIGLPASTSIHAFAPDLLKAAKPMMFGGTDPVLTHMGNRWLFRCRPSDIYSARVIARFGIEELKKKRWAILYSTEAFGRQA